MRGLNALAAKANAAIVKANANPNDPAAQREATSASNDLARFRAVRRARNSGH